MNNRELGGKKAAKTNKLKHGEDFYKRIGATGGKKGKVGGFNTPGAAYVNGVKSAALRKWSIAGNSKDMFPTNLESWEAIAKW